MTKASTALDVLEFWWKAGPAQWFSRSDEFDSACRDQFGMLHARAAEGQLADWADVPHGMLALIIILDQLSRNIHRGTPKAFAQDDAALALAEEAVDRGFDRAYPMPAKSFFYMPFMHAEAIAAQERCVDLFRAAGDRDSEYYALLHLDVIRRFDRFPHRNPVLGRETTEAEKAYLESGGFTA